MNPQNNWEKEFLDAWKTWEAIKERYSQSGLFDLAQELRAELDADVSRLLSSTSKRNKGHNTNTKKSND